MINQKNAPSYNNELGEKCRKALEKSYGSTIPIPEHTMPNSGIISTSINLEIMPKFKPNRVRLIAFLVGVVSMVYAVGIASDLFALPMFSAFFFVSYETAHKIAYAAATVGGLLLLTSTIIVVYKARMTRIRS